MAKKAKKSAKKAKRAPAKKGAAKEKGRPVSVHAVVTFVRRLQELGRLDEFLAFVGPPEKSKAYVTLRGQSFDVVNRYVHEKLLTGPTPKGATITAEDGVIEGCPPFECFDR